MASMTASGFCELAVLSRYTSGFPCTWRDRIGKSLRISAALWTFCSVPADLLYVTIVSPDFYADSILIFSELDLFSRSGFAIQAHSVLVYSFDLPALLGINPGIGLSFVSPAHTAYYTAAQACTQVFQRNALQHWFEETLYDDALRFCARDATHHQVEKLL